MRALTRLLLAMACLATAWAQAASPSQNVRVMRFAALQQPGSDDALQQALVSAGRNNPEFIVINGIKGSAEPCSDALYQQRRNLLNESARPVVVSLAGSDWVDCMGEDGAPNAVERLQRLREMFFEGDRSLGPTKTRLVRQSIMPKFRGFPENAYWQRGKILFATVHLPAENNHYLAAAGRNSEFEDRLIANRHWLQRVFNFARLHKMRGIVLFMDGDPMAIPKKSNAERRDGFLEMRKTIAQLSSRFAGRVLLVHARPAARSAAQIAWNGNLGMAGAGADVLEIVANPASSRVFAIARQRAGKAAKN